jgi:hypothetical protein
MVLSSTLDLRAERGSQLIGDAFDYLIDRNAMFDESNRKLSLVNAKLEKQRDDALKQFDIVRKDKERLEQELYSKFVLVLNAKKQKANEFKRQIAQLQSRVDSLTADLDAAMTRASRRPADAALAETSPVVSVDATAAAATKAVKRVASIAKATPTPTVKKPRNSLAPTPTLPSQLSQLSLPMTLAPDDDIDVDLGGGGGGHGTKVTVDDDDNDNVNDDDDMPPPPLPLGKARKTVSSVRASQFGLLPTAPPLSATINDADLLSRSDDSDEAVPLSAGETALHRVTTGYEKTSSPGRRVSAVRRTTSEKQAAVGAGHGGGGEASSESSMRRGGAMTKAVQPQSVPTSRAATTPHKGRAAAGAASSASRSTRRGQGHHLADSIGASGLLKEASQQGDH